MLSYRHAFHAGNKADIFKHSILTLLVSHFLQKETPFTYVDTHAGLGLYNLQSEWALKTGEGQEGIVEFLKTLSNEDIPKTCIPYIDICKELLLQQTYAGSPEIVRRLSRAQDSLILSELQKSDYETLYKITKRDKRIHVHNRNGFEMLKALSFPQRTLVLIDPSYETQDDYNNVAVTVEAFYKKCATAVIAVWYPLVNRREAETSELKRGLSCIVPIDEKFCVTEHVYRDIKGEDFGMYGSGMAIINPPWLYTKEIDSVYDFINSQLGMNISPAI